MKRAIKFLCFSNTIGREAFRTVIPFEIVLCTFPTGFHKRFLLRILDLELRGFNTQRVNVNCAFNKNYVMERFFKSLFSVSK